MAEEPDPNAGAAENPPAPSPEQSSSRRKPMTPELRRFNGPGRSWREREAAKEEAAQSAESSSENRAPRPPESARPEPWPSHTEPTAAEQMKPERRRSPGSTPAV